MWQHPGTRRGRAYACGGACALVESSSALQHRRWSAIVLWCSFLSLSLMLLSPHASLFYIRALCHPRIKGLEPLLLHFLYDRLRRCQFTFVRPHPVFLAPLATSCSHVCCVHCPSPLLPQGSFDTRSPCTFALNTLSRLPPEYESFRPVCPLLGVRFLKSADVRTVVGFFI